MRSMLRFVDVAPTAPEAVGQVLPYGFGIVRRFPAIPVITGAQTAYTGWGITSDTLIAQPLLASELGPVGFIGAASDASMSRFMIGQTGGGQYLLFRMGGELLVGIPQVSPPGFRGVFRTLPIDHQVGEAVHELRQWHKYLVCENPGTHRVRAIAAVYLNGLFKDPGVAPAHVVDLNDQTVIPGRSVVSVRFDTSALSDINSPFAAPQDVSSLQRWVQENTRTIEEQVVSGYTAVVRPGRNGYTSYYNAPYGGVVIGWTPTYSTVSRTLAPSGGGPRVYPLLGAVEVDLTGLQDDPAGTITGIPNTLLTRPAHIAHVMLREAFGQRDAGAVFNVAEFAEAASLQAALGLQWAVRFGPMNYSEWQQAVETQSRTRIFQDASGVWRASFNRRSTLPSVTFERTRRMSWSLRWSPERETVTHLHVTNGGGDERLEKVLVSGRYVPGAEVRDGSLDLPWVSDASAAEALGQYALSKVDHPRPEIRETRCWDNMQVSRGDPVTVSDDALTIFGGSQFPFRVRGIRVQPTGLHEFDLEEEEQTFEEQLSLVESLALQRLQFLADTLGMTEGLAKAIARSHSETISLSEAFESAFSAPIPGELLELTESLSLQVQKAFVENLGLSEVLTGPPAPAPTALFLRRTWGLAKPVGFVRVDEGHPLAAGLVAAWLLADMGGLLVRDALGRWPGTLTGAGWSWGVDTRGVVLISSGTSGTYVDCGAIPLDSSNWTIAMRVRTNNVGLSKRYAAWGGAGPTIWHDGANPSHLGIVHSGVVDLQASGDTVADNDVVSIAIARSGSRARIYKDGRTIASSDAFSVSYTQDSQFRIGNSSAFGEQLAGRFDYVYAWGRGITESEALQLHLAPYQFLGRRRAVPVFAG